MHTGVYSGLVRPRRLSVDPLALSFAEHPVTSSIVLQTAVGAAIGAVGGAGLGLLFPAKAAALTMTGAVSLGARFAAKGLKDGAQLDEFLNPGQVKHASMGADLHTALTASTGSMVLDAVVGGAIGWALYPTMGFLLTGAFLTAVGGVSGIGLLAVYRLAVVR